MDEKFLVPTKGEHEQLSGLIETNGDKDKCWLAMKAAWDTLSEYCGSAGVPMEMDGISLTVPVDVIEMSRTHPEMSHDERIRIVADTEWCRGTAMNMCETLFGADRETTAYPECIENVAERIARKIID